MRTVTIFDSLDELLDAFINFGKVPDPAAAIEPLTLDPFLFRICILKSGGVQIQERIDANWVPCQSIQLNIIIDRQVLLDKLADRLPYFAHQ